MDGAVVERHCERLVHEPVLVDEGKPVEALAPDRDLEVVSAAGAVVDLHLVRVGKGSLEQLPQSVRRHVAIVAAGAVHPGTGVWSKGLRERSDAPYPSRVVQLGLFPLGIVLLPGELAPLHIFEPRYKELIGECLDADQEFGLIFSDERGDRELGTRASVVDILERFEDGRLNIIVRGGERFRVVERTSGRSFQTGEVESVDDEADEPAPEQVERVRELYGRVAEIAGSEAEDLDDEQLSFAVAARVDFGVEMKQRLLELTSEAARLRLLARLLETAAEALARVEERRRRAQGNGSLRGG